MAEQLILVDVSNGVATITMNRPRKGNAFNTLMVEQWHAALDRLLADAQVRVLVITGSGKYFCTGMDLSAKNQGAMKANLSKGSDGFLTLMQRLKTCKLPVVAKINGPVLGGGIGIVFCCDLRVTTDHTFFQFSEVKRGLVPAMISTFIVPQIGPFISKELFLTGRRVPAQLALSQHWVTAVAVPQGAESKADALTRVTEEYLAELRTSAPGAMALIKDLVEYVRTHTHEENLPEAKKVFGQSMLSEETQYGLGKFRAKQVPNWAEFAAKRSKL